MEKKKGVLGQSGKIPRTLEKIRGRIKFPFGFGGPKGERVGMKLPLVSNN